MTLQRQTWLAAAIALAVFLPRGAWVALSHSDSADDEYHLVRGLEFLQRDPGLIHRELNDPPLGQALGALPLWLAGCRTDVRDGLSAIYHQPISPPTVLLLVALWKSLLFVPLVPILFRWLAGLYGTKAGWLAVLILCTEPNIAAHVPLASLDAIGAEMIALACLAGWRLAKRPSRGRLIVASLAVAAAMLTKHTAVLVPAVVAGFVLLLRGQESIGSRVGVVVRAAVLVCLFIWALLLFDVSQPVKTGGDGPRLLQHPLPAGLYVASVREAARHAKYANDSYLWGEWRRGSWWYYFPAVAAYKVPLGLLGLIVLGAVSLMWRWPGREEWSLAVPGGLWTAFMLAQSINIGFRHFLPALLFLLMLSCRLAIGRKTAIVAFSLAGLAAVHAAAFGPDCIAYINFPRARAHLAISDSNIDWGQALWQARDWIDAEGKAMAGGRTIHIRPFATSRRAVRYWIGDRARLLWWGDGVPAGGLLVLSPVSEAGGKEPQDLYGRFREQEPVAVIGHTLRVYDLDHPKTSGAKSGK